MTTVTAFTAERMQAIEDSAIVGGTVVGDNLVLTRHDGTTFIAGNVRGIVGPATAEDIEMHGAVGDNVTDCTALIQSALDEVELNGGGRVFIPIGIFKTTGVIEIPPNVELFGAGEDVSVINYTGAGTGIRAKYYATASQKRKMFLHDFQLTCTTAAVGIDAKGWFKCNIHRVHVKGNTVTPVVGSIAMLFDASLGYSVGCWYNIVDDCYIEGFSTNIKFTGVPGNGQANENTVIRTRLASYTTYGIWIDSGNHMMIDDNDLTCSMVGATGIYNNDIDTQIKPNRFENTDYAIRIGPLSKRVHILPQLFSDILTAIQIDAGAQDTYVYDGGLFTGVTTMYVDNGVQTRVTKTRMVGAPLIPLNFAKQDIAAGQSSLALVPVGEDTLNLLKYVGTHYQIRGLSFRSNTVITAGQITLKPTIGGVESTTLSMVAGVGAPSVNSGEGWQGVGKDINNGASGIGVKATTTADFAPAGSLDFGVIVWVELVRSIT